MTTIGDFAVKNFSVNLRFLCSHYPSVALACRKIGINRAQFMKYISGNSFPSRHTLRRICDFFEVEEHEMLMTHQEFRNIVGLRPSNDAAASDIPPNMMKVLQNAQASRPLTSRTVGSYFTYIFAFSVPNQILKSLTVIFDWNQYTLYRRFERLRREPSSGAMDVYKYGGIVTVAGNRMHMIDYETITQSELTHSILYMNYRNRVTILTGLTTGVSGADAREPSCSRVVMEFIGRSINTRKALAECSAYPRESPHIPRHVIENLTAGQGFPGPLRAVIL